MAYGELGILPMSLHAQSKNIMFWAEIKQPSESIKLSNAI